MRSSGSPWRRWHLQVCILLQYIVCAWYVIYVWYRGRYFYICRMMNPFNRSNPQRLRSAPAALIHSIEATDSGSESLRVYIAATGSSNLNVSQPHQPHSSSSSSPSLFLVTHLRVRARRKLRDVQEVWQHLVPVGTPSQGTGRHAYHGEGSTGCRYIHCT